MGTTVHPTQTLLRTLARYLAFAAEGRQREALRKVRERCLDLLDGIDPDRVDRDGPSYRCGGYDALAATLFALEEQSLSASTLELLLKSERARILNAVLAYPGRNQKQLAKELQLYESNFAVYLRDLVDEGLLEPSPALEQRGRSYSLTPWGRKAWSQIVLEPQKYQVPKDELLLAMHVIDSRAPYPINLPLLSKTEFYRKMMDELIVESNCELHFSTFATASLKTDNDGPSASFHRQAIEAIKHLRRPLSWILPNSEEHIADQLIANANLAKAPLQVYLIEPPDQQMPTRQILENVALLYPAAPDKAQIVDRAEALAILNEFIEKPKQIRNSKAVVLGVPV